MTAPNLDDNDGVMIGSAGARAEIRFCRTALQYGLNATMSLETHPLAGLHNNMNLNAAGGLSK